MPLKAFVFRALGAVPLPEQHLLRECTEVPVTQRTAGTARWFCRDDCKPSDWVLRRTPRGNDG